MATNKETPNADVAPEEDELAALDSLEKEASEFKKDAEIDRISRAFKLDAYTVLDLLPGVTESDIKVAYRKKSLLIHPDKTTNPAAPGAFDALKKAQTTLMDEKARARLDESIADARHLLMRERKLNPDSPEMKEPLSDEIRKAWREMTVKVLVDEELRRRRQAQAQMREEGREQQKADEEADQRKRKREHEQAWESTREARIGSWRDFQKTKASGDAKAKKKKMKVLG